MCAEVNEEYFYVVHHEMGHCHYYLAYNEHQPPLFQVSISQFLYYRKSLFLYRKGITRDTKRMKKR